MANGIMITKLSSKGQATIPSKVRKRLGVKPGDSVLFVIDGDRVTLKRAEKLDAGFLKLAAETFSDWNAPEADEAFRDLYALGRRRRPLPFHRGRRGQAPPSACRARRLAGIDPPRLLGGDDYHREGGRANGRHSHHRPPEGWVTDGMRRPRE